MYIYIYIYINIRKNPLLPEVKDQPDSHFLLSTITKNTFQKAKEFAKVKGVFGAHTYTRRLHVRQAPTRTAGAHTYSRRRQAPQFTHFASENPFEILLKFKDLVQIFKKKSQHLFDDIFYEKMIDF